MENASINNIRERKIKLQQELTSFLSTYMSGEELQHIKQLIADYYSKKLSAEIDKLAVDQGWTQDTYDGWWNEHMRTPYHKQ